jgi:hypothetical protein
MMRVERGRMGALDVWELKATQEVLLLQNDTAAGICHVPCYCCWCCSCCCCLGQGERPHYCRRSFC